MNTTIQFDNRPRVVALANLKAMCERVSGMCHRYTVEKVTKRFVHVSYSNPDEWGSAHPMVAVFPCYLGNEDAVRVVLEYHDVKHDNWHGEGWQAFECLRDCPELWRGPDGKWKTREEWDKLRATATT